LKAAASERECVLSVAFNSASFLSESDVFSTRVGSAECGTGINYIEYNGKLEIRNSLLNVVLYDKPEIGKRDASEEPR
jgi:hypothetical protein